MSVLKIVAGLIGLAIGGYFTANLPSSLPMLLMVGVVFSAPSMAMLWEGGSEIAGFFRRIARPRPHPE
jgi:hypothetical protein